MKRALIEYNWIIVLWWVTMQKHCIINHEMYDDVIALENFECR